MEPKFKEPPTPNFIGEKKTRTPGLAESIEAGAMKLTLEERVNLCKKLAVSIKKEVARKQEDLNNAQKLIDGLK